MVAFIEFGMDRFDDHNGVVHHNGNEFIDRWGEVKPLLEINDEIAHSVKMLETLELDIEIQAHNEWLNNFLKRYGT